MGDGRHIGKYIFSYNSTTRFARSFVWRRKIRPKWQSSVENFESWKLTMADGFAPKPYGCSCYKLLLGAGELPSQPIGRYSCFDVCDRSPDGARASRHVTLTSSVTSSAQRSAPIVYSSVVIVEILALRWVNVATSLMTWRRRRVYDWSQMLKYWTKFITSDLHGPLQCDLSNSSNTTVRQPGRASVLPLTGCGWTQSWGAVDVSSTWMTLTRTPSVSTNYSSLLTINCSRKFYTTPLFFSSRWFRTAHHLLMTSVLAHMTNFCLTKLHILMIGNLSYGCSTETVTDWLLCIICQWTVPFFFFTLCCLFFTFCHIKLRMSAF